MRDAIGRAAVILSCLFAAACAEDVADSPPPLETPVATSPELAPEGAPEKAAPLAPAESGPAPIGVVPTGAPKALILVDARLSAKLPELEEYRQRASIARGFPIELVAEAGLDDWSPVQTRAFLKQKRAASPELEGVVLVGNVKLPSFYKSRSDIIATRLMTRMFEDLDGAFLKRQAEGSIDPKCTGSNEPCNATGPKVVPKHDYDYVAKGPTDLPELYVSLMPVGTSGANDYDAWAGQLKPYLAKVLSYYRRELKTNGRFYFVSNDRGEDPQGYFSAFGAANVDLFGKPGPSGETGTACIKPDGQNVCYVRWPLESYTSVGAFITAHKVKWVGEGWQQPKIFLSHMNASLYDIVEVNTHGNGGSVLASTAEARTITQGAPVIALDGCSSTEFVQPGSTSGNDARFTVDRNVAVGYLYGSSKVIVAFGDAFDRGHYAHNPTMWKALRAGASVGRAHASRLARLYESSGTSTYAFRENGMEMLLGDPFFDLSLSR